MSSMPGTERERLQPALLDRLMDDAPAVASDVDGGRAMTKAGLRQAVLRDLSNLLNTVQALGAEARKYPLAADSVLNYGLPPLSGQLASQLDMNQLERILWNTIARFEPRILRESLRVRAIESASVMDTHNLIEFEICGQLWSQPVPLEILLRTQIDLEAGRIELREALGASARRPAHP